jgi:hypothetical protein
MLNCYDVKGGLIVNKVDRCKELVRSITLGQNTTKRNLLREAMVGVVSGIL